MSQPKKPLVGPHSKIANLHSSGKHPLAGSAPASLGRSVAPIRGGPGQTWFNLKKSDLDEYARSHPANPGPSLLQTIIAGFKLLVQKLLRKFTQTP
jgi:hypothetical protein